LDVWVVDVEPGPLECVAVIDFGSVDLLHALSVDHELYAVELVGDVVVIDLGIEFEFVAEARATSGAHTETQSDAVVVFARDELGDFRFEIVGHTDSSGSADYNRNLSERRAESVRAFLIDKGVAAGRLDWTGYGEDEPLLPDDPGNPSNRRVEIRNLGESSQ
jgi:OOP family OmpA-OmpF porin